MNILVRLCRTSALLFPKEQENHVFHDMSPSKPLPLKNTLKNSRRLTEQNTTEHQFNKITTSCNFHTLRKRLIAPLNTEEEAMKGERKDVFWPKGSEKEKQDGERAEKERMRDTSDHGSFQMAFVKCGEVSNYPLKSVWWLNSDTEGRLLFSS